MKKFTKLWQLMLVLMLTSSVVFAQKSYSLQDANKEKTHKATPELQKQYEQQQLMEQIQFELINLKTTSLQQKVVEQGKTPVISPAKVKPVTKPYQSPKAVLYSQMIASGGGGSSQDFSAANDIYDATGADDFTVVGGPWNVQKISWIGSNNNSVNGPGFNIEFYTDNAGMPGTLIASYPDNFTTAVGSGTGPYTYTSYLPAPEVLADGTYWIIIQARWDFGTWGQFYWGYADPATTYGYEAVWQNPGDGFETGFTTWTGINTVWPGNFDFTFELSDDPPPACVDPSVLWALDFTSTSTTIGWTENGAATTWDIEYGPTGFVPGTGTTVTGVTNPYNLSGLSTGVDYDWYVRADCGAGSYSGWVMSGFRLPDYFASITPTTTCQTDAGSFLAGGMAWYTVTMDDLSEYNFSVCDQDVTCAGAMPVADGDFYLYDTDGTTLLWYWDGQSGCSWDASTWGTIYESWSPDVSGNYYLRVEDYYGTNADNFTLGYISAPVATCPAPTAQTATAITTTGADLGWTEVGTATAWDVEWGLQGFAPGSGTTITDASNPVSLTGLSSGTSYDWYVKAKCSPFDHSTWTGPHTFATACLLTIPPGAIAESEACGTDVNGGCNMAAGTETWEPVNPNDIVHGTFWADAGMGGRDTDWYELVLDNTYSAYTVTINADAESPMYIFEITTTTMGTPDCASSAVGLQATVGPCTPGSFTTATYAPGTYWFWAGSTSFDGFPCTQNYWMEFVVTPITCPDPTALGVTNMTTTTADLIWTSNSGLSDLEFGLAGFTIGVDPIVSATGVTSPYGVTGLVSGTDYEFYVMDDCSGSTSNWAGPFAFTGMYPPPANDECVNAEPVTAPYPATVSGTTLGATVDCPGVLNWDAVWYAIDLPYTFNYVSIDLCLDDAGATLANTGIILTSDCSCDVGSFIYSTGAYTVAANCINNLDFDGIVGPTTVYYPVLTDPKGDFTFDVDVIEQFGVIGVATYGTGGPIDINVNLFDAVPAQIGATTSSAAGLYAFSPLADGDYHLEGQTYKERGGTTIFDAVRTRQFLGASFAFTPLQQAAANVNNNAAVDIFDAVLMQQSLSGGLPALWTAPDWLYTDPSFTMAGATMNVDMQTLCSGNPTGSYAFPAGFNTPPGGTCASAIVIGGIPFSDAGLTTCGFGNDYTDPCGSSYMNGEDFVYEFTPGSDISIDIALSNTDTWTGVFVIEGCPDVGTCVASATSSGGNPVLAGASLTAGTTYYIVVSTWPSPDCTPFDIDITVAAGPPANDDCSNAEVVGEVTDQVFSTVSATASGLGTCMTSADIWYVYTATADGSITVDLCGSVFDTKLSVYDGTCGALNELGCNDDSCGLQSSLTIPVVSGISYYIQVGGYSSNTGDGDITIVYTP